jgi:uncharacterized membrane protein
MIAFLRRRWMPVALVASLGINMFLVGFLVGNHGGPPPPPPDPQRIVDRAIEMLPPQDADVLRAVWDRLRPSMPPGPPLRDFPLRVKAILLREPFDPDALSRLFEEQERLEKKRRALLLTGLIEAATAMSPEGRKRLAELRP